MTCQELRRYLEGPLRPDAEFRVEAEHLTHCDECAHFAETQGQLLAGLRRLREALPQFPERLDSSVLADYRRDVAHRAPLPISDMSRRRMGVLCLTGALVAMVLIAVVLAFRPRAAQPMPGSQRPVLAVVSQSVAVQPTVRFLSPAKVRGSHPARGRRSRLGPATTPAVRSPSFQSLMYCDELSCSGVMDVIRVQVPSANVALRFDSSAAGGTVVADVLVGPDGIARGIRIVE